MAEIRKLKIGKQIRGFAITRADVNEEKRTIGLSFSSESPVERWFGIEILDHSSEKSVDLKRLKRGGALLIDHDTRNQVGVIEDVLIDTADRKGRAEVRFGRSAKAEEIFQDVLDGIRSNVSVGYMIDDLILEKEEKGQPPIYRATKWTPYEISLVAVPADINCGVGRGADDEGAKEFEFEVKEAKITIKQEVVKMKCRHCGKDLVEGVCLDKCEERKLNVAVQDVRKAEQTRVADILAIGKKHNCAELAETSITEGRSVDEFKSAVLAKMAEKPPIDTNLDMSQKEANKYSYARAMAAAIGLAEGKRESSFEVEVSDTLRKQMPINAKDRGGIIIPLATRAGLDSKTATAGTELVYTEFGGELIELLRTQAVLARLGARIRTGLSSPISFPRKTAEGAAVWVAENPGSDASDTDDTTETVTLTPKPLTRSTSISRQLIVQSIVDAEADIRSSISSSIALAIDQAGIHGIGSNNQPKGIYYASNVNAKAMGGVPTFGKLIDMITEVAKDNAALGTLGFVTTPGMAGKLLQTLVASSAGSAMIWSGRIDEGLMCGYNALATNQVKSTLGAGAEHGLVFGNWLDIIIGMFGGIEITVDPYRLKKQAMIEYTIFAMADVLLRHPESFCKATGATII